MEVWNKYLLSYSNHIYPKSNQFKMLIKKILKFILNYQIILSTFGENDK
jgi:hypothetical protein